MSLLIDTNVLLRIAQTSSPDHGTAKSAVLALVDADVKLCIVPQIIYEFWVVATRPQSVNGLGMDVAGALRSITGIVRDYQLLRDERGIYGNWLTLVSDNQVMGKTAHDARLAAAMQRHQLTKLLTFNKPDFTRFTTIQVFTPAEVLAGQIPV
jgi:predicted nucleic acid-binding protein